MIGRVLRLGFLVKVMARDDLKRNDARRHASQPHLKVSLGWHHMPPILICRSVMAWLRQRRRANNPDPALMEKNVADLVAGRDARPDRPGTGGSLGNSCRRHLWKYHGEPRPISGDVENLARTGGPTTHRARARRLAVLSRRCLMDPQSHRRPPARSWNPRKCTNSGKSVGRPAGNDWFNPEPGVQCSTQQSACFKNGKFSVIHTRCMCG